LGSGRLVVTPWRGVLVPDLPLSEVGAAAELLAAAGLVMDDGSPWHGVTACTGAPRCAHGEDETRSLAGRIIAERAAAAGSVPASALPIHIVGCARRCGSPLGRHVEALTSPGQLAITLDGPAFVVRAADGPAAVVTAAAGRSGAGFGPPIRERR
jgi:precorrin-3B synthase